MQSGKQKRAAIMLRRQERRQQAEVIRLADWVSSGPAGGVPVDKRKLAGYNSYGEPAFVQRGFYVDVAFTCRDCGARQVWTADQQQWWYETAKGYVYSTAIRCAECRRQRRLALGRGLRTSH